MTTRRALVALVTLVAGSWALNACARTPESPLDKWQAGTQYTLLPTPRPTNVPAGKVEVVEVFWYGCSHCNHLDPLLESWKASKPAYVEFVRVPVVWGPQHYQHAKLYYTLVALHRLDLHTKVFDAIHKEGLFLAARDEQAARAMQFALLNRDGVTEKEFDAAYDSMTVATNLQRAQELTKTLPVDSVPIMLVNGKYRTSVSEAGSEEKMLQLVNDLAASEKGR